MIPYCYYNPKSTNGKLPCDLFSLLTIIEYLCPPGAVTPQARQAKRSTPGKQLAVLLIYTF